MYRTELFIFESTEDWSDKSKAAAAEIFPGVPLRRGIEHLKRNLRSNQTQGKRGPRKSKAKALAKAQAKAKALPRPAPRPAPHLSSRSIWAAINVITEIMYMPSKTMMHVALECFLDWVRLQWGEQQWHDYFVREYVDRCTLSDADQRTFGRRELFMPHWWSGAGNCRRWNQPGHPASQQAAEQQNSKIKKDIREHAPERKLTTHQAVVTSIQGCLRTWLRPIQAVDAASTLSPVTLMGLPGGVQLSRPDRPDAWMLAKGRVVRKPCSNKLFFFPPISQSLSKMRLCKKTLPYEQKCIKDAKCFGGNCDVGVLFPYILISARFLHHLPQVLVSSGGCAAQGAARDS